MFPLHMTQTKKGSIATTVARAIVTIIQALAVAVAAEAAEAVAI